MPFFQTEYVVQILHLSCFGFISFLSPSQQLSACFLSFIFPREHLSRSCYQLHNLSYFFEALRIIVCKNNLKKKIQETKNCRRTYKNRNFLLSSLYMKMNPPWAWPVAFINFYIIFLHLALQELWVPCGTHSYPYTFHININYGWKSIKVKCSSHFFLLSFYFYFDAVCMSCQVYICPSEFCRQNNFPKAL